MLRARDNPFSTDRVLRQRYRIDAVGLQALHVRLRGLSFRAALVGPHGSGKTTLWEDLATQLEEQGWTVHRLRLSEENRILDARYGPTWSRQLGLRDLVLLDGAEQLSWLRWWLFRHTVRRAGGLLITTHRAGRLPTLHRCTTSPALLAELSSALGQPLEADDAAELYARFRGNIREALRELYERAADRAPASTVGALLVDARCP